MVVGPRCLCFARRGQLGLDGVIRLLIVFFFYKNSTKSAIKCINGWHYEYNMLEYNWKEWYHVYN